MMTLREFAERLEVVRQEEQRWDLRFAVIGCVTANFSMGKDPDQPPITPHDLFPSTIPEPPPEPDPPPEQTIAFLQMWAARCNRSQQPN